MSLRAELGSTASTLEQLLERVTAIADELVGGSKDSTGSALLEVERMLKAASRRLDRVVSDLDGD